MHICMFAVRLFFSQHTALPKTESQPRRPFTLRAKRHDEQATENILRPADEPQASSQRSCGPFGGEETEMEGTLPARLGTHLGESAGPRVQSRGAARDTRNSLAALGFVPSGQSSNTVHATLWSTFNTGGQTMDK